jgi:hypothetical protein
VTHVQICRPSTGKISKRTLSPETRFFAPLAFCTEGPNHYMAMVLAILWVCVSNMHSHVMVWALGAKSDFGGSWVTRMYICTSSVQCQPITYKGLVLEVKCDLPQVRCETSLVVAEVAHHSIKAAMGLRQTCGSPAGRSKHDSNRHSKEQQTVVVRYGNTTTTASIRKYYAITTSTKPDDRHKN